MWITHTYECDFDTIGSQVFAVRAYPGRMRKKKSLIKHEPRRLAFKRGGSYLLVCNSN